MAWLTYGNDKDPGAIAAAAGMHVSGHGIPGIMNYVDPWDRAIAGVNKDVEEYLKRKQDKEIADMLNQQKMAALEQDQYQFEQGQGLRDAQIRYYDRRDGEGNGAMTAYQRARESRLSARDARLAAGKTSDPAKVLTGHSAGEWADLYNRSTSGDASEFRDDPNNPNAYLGTFGSNEKGEPKFSSIPKKMFAELQRNSLGGQAPASSGNGAAAPLQSDVDQAAAAIAAGDPAAAIADAKAAISKGANPDAVKKRLQSMGIDTSGL